MPEIIQPGDINRGIKPANLVWNLNSNKLYFDYGHFQVPCRCRLETPIDPDYILDYLAELDFHQIEVPHLIPGIYQVGFTRMILDQTIIIRVEVINQLLSKVSPPMP